MRIICLGAGAVGGYFAGMLAEANAADVAFLVREARKVQLRRDGLRIESVHGNLAIPVRAIEREEIGGPADIVLLTCKAYDLDTAIEAIRPAVGPRSAVLPLLNGLSHIDRLNAAFGRERVLGGLARIAITLQPDGLIKHLNDWRFITFGEQDGRISERVLSLKAAFDKTSVVAEAVPDVMHQMWEKLVQLATLAGMTTLMRASLGEIARTAGGTALMQELLARNAEIAAKSGFSPSAEFMERMRTFFADTTSTFAASMLRDIEQRRPVEADHIIGFLLERARALGVDDTLLRICRTHLEVYEQRRAAGRV
jgi:2-dehydropantoate 2-reductase